MGTTPAERIQRGFHRLGLVFLFVCVFAALMFYASDIQRNWPERPLAAREDGRAVLVPADQVATPVHYFRPSEPHVPAWILFFGGFGYSVLVGLGWALSGFFRDKTD